MHGPAHSPGQGNRGRASALPAQGWRWRRVFSGDERELSSLRRWLGSLLPTCPALDDVMTVAVELATNAIRHTASGRGGWFAAAITWHEPVVQVAVADCGGLSEPTVIDDPMAEHGRGLLLVRGLSVRMGVVGDRHGRLVWAQILSAGGDPAAHEAAQDPYQAAVREGEVALAQRFAGVPTWFGRSTLAWWAMAGPTGLVPAPTAQELAELLHRILNAPHSPHSQAAMQPCRDGAAQRPQLQDAWLHAPRWLSPISLSLTRGTANLCS